MTAPTPAIPSFADGLAPTAEQLNDLTANIRNLYDLTMAGFRPKRPMCVVRINRENREVPTNTDHQVQWDATEIDTDHMWSGVFSEVIEIQTPGVYRLGLQFAVQPITAPSNAIIAGRIVVTNGGGSAGVDVAADSAAVSFAPYVSGIGAGVHCSVVASLPRGMRVRAFVTHTAGAAVALDPAFGGSRMSAVWLGPIP